MARTRSSEPQAAARTRNLANSVACQSRIRHCRRRPRLPGRRGGGCRQLESDPSHLNHSNGCGVSWEAVLEQSLLLTPVMITVSDDPSHCEVDKAGLESVWTALRSTLSAKFLNQAAIP